MLDVDLQAAALAPETSFTVTVAAAISDLSGYTLGQAVKSRFTSLDVTARFHARAPETPWLLAECSSPVARDGLVASAGSVWSAGGQLLASGGQQMLCRPMSLQE